MTAARKGHADVSNILLDQRVNVNAKDADGVIAMSIACRAGKLSIVQAHLNRGASVNSLDRYDNSPLTYAALSGHTNIVQLLLEKGASINLTANNGWTLLMNASQKGYAGVTKLLLKYGADFHKKLPNGFTALAIESRHNRVLITMGCGPSKELKSNLTTDEPGQIVESTLLRADQIVVLGDSVFLPTKNDKGESAIIEISVNQQKNRDLQGIQESPCQRRYFSLRS
ncbi:unnamed protein product [Phytophthora lilii]|uniref:Unnamed protein product n=1 Tax=Phytophthora lilii TaxID=2077276 RepID=A0A9W6WR63_9STRA|nr:unnamed protein product [Phytophthora lilii]